MWDAAARIPAAGLLFTSISLGPGLGPMVAGLYVPLNVTDTVLSSEYFVSSIVSSDADWRWVFWVEMIFAAVCTIV